MKKKLLCLIQVHDTLHEFFDGTRNCTKATASLMPLHGFRAKISRLPAGILTLKNRFRGRRLALLPALLSIASCFSANVSDFTEPCCEDSALPGMEVILPQRAEYLKIAHSVFGGNGARDFNVTLSILIREDVRNHRTWYWLMMPPASLLILIGIPMGTESNALSVEAKLVSPHGSDKIYSATCTGWATKGLWFWNYDIEGDDPWKAAQYRAYRNCLLEIHKQMEKDATEIRRLTHR